MTSQDCNKAKWILCNTIRSSSSSERDSFYQGRLSPQLLTSSLRWLVSNNWLPQDQHCATNPFIYSHSPSNANFSHWIHYTFAHMQPQLWYIIDECVIIFCNLCVADGHNMWSYNQSRRRFANKQAVPQVEALCHPLMLSYLQSSQIFHLFFVPLSTRLCAIFHEFYHLQHVSSDTRYSIHYLRPCSSSPYVNNRKKVTMTYPKLRKEIWRTVSYT